MNINEYIENINEKIQSIYSYLEEEMPILENIKDRLLKIELFQYLIIFLIIVCFAFNFIMFLYLIHRINYNKIETLKLQQKEKTRNQ